MKYRAEIVQNGEVIAHKNYNHATHPQQTVRDIIESQKIPIDYAEVYVMNDNGERWKYTISRLSNGKIEGTIAKTSYDQLSRDQVISVFAGNSQIRRAKRQ